MTNDQLWQSTLGELELLISKANFTTWFKNTYIDSCKDGHIVIAVPNAFTKAWLEKKYHDFILKALNNITNQSVKQIAYQVNINKARVNYYNSAAPSVATFNQEQPVNNIGLSPNYTFDSFIVGKNNELARAAALAVTQSLGQTYNPLFLYGGAGLGKTHLLQAIGHEIVKSDPNKKVSYITCEKFTNEFIEAISKGTMEKFKNRYRSVDALLVDDVQFLAGKEGTQEEFFHTFNNLHQANKQIVITSDRPPKAIPTLEHRLVSRFEWGMLADILSPDLETRTAILEAKCKEKNCVLNGQIINYLATTIQNNVRELEGALNKIIAYHQLNNQPSTLDSVKSILQTNSQHERGQALTTKKIINVVSRYYDVKIEDLLGASRKKQLVTPRQIAMYLMRNEIKASYPTIGQELGNRDHTTAMHAYIKISAALNNDGTIQQDIHLIHQQLYNN
ncbi:MAG: chromosomal replication initiator protein DnaA [Patescibacteria group bacterium]